ncbi:MAG: hypothetical protein AAGA85_17895, partial [Bacteroidota bacterium]
IAAFAASCTESQEPDPAIDIEFLSQSPLFPGAAYEITDLELSFHVVEFHPFGDKYVIAGFDGFVVTDHDFNVLTEFKDDLITHKVLTYGGVALVATNRGLFQINASVEVKKILEVPITDLEIDGSGRLLFVQGLGELSKEKQEPANIHILNLQEQSSEFFTDPTDSLNTFLNQIEIAADGTIWALGSEHTIFQFRAGEMIQRFSNETLDILPDMEIYTGQGLLEVEGNTVYYATDNVHEKRVVRYDGAWDLFLRVDVTGFLELYQQDLISSHTRDVEIIGDEVWLGYRDGIIRSSGDEFTIVQDPNLLDMGIDKIYPFDDGRMVFILNQRQIAEVRPGL